MIQENGMPIEFQAWIIDEKRIAEVTDIDWRNEWIVTRKVEGCKRFGYSFKEVILLQAIGATDSSDPPQELYLGDLIEFYYDGEVFIGEIVWREYRVDVRFKRRGGIVYMGSFDHLEKYSQHKYTGGDGFIKKLGSCRDPELKEVLEKAGLE